MTDDLWDPRNEDGLTFSGKHTDGTVTVALQIRVEVPDEIGLRGQHLVDIDGAQPDWGSDAAVLKEVMRVLMLAPWASSAVRPTFVQARAGGTSSATPGDYFLGGPGGA